MCGIVGYIGTDEALPIIIKGLKRLEYRGYDSSGVALMNGDIKLFKCKGKVSDLEAHMAGETPQSTMGMGHTRWATHGEPNDINAHPHFSQSGELVIIHNGIIENYEALKKELIKRGYSFKSDTDTEVLINLIEELKKIHQTDLKEAVRLALNEVVGAYAILVMSSSEPDTMVAARKSSPMVVGIKNGSFYIASDATPFIEYTKEVVYIKDEEIAVLTRGQKMELFTILKEEKTPFVEELELHLEAIEKGGYDHFMMKEIYEQPRSIHDSMRGRIRADKGIISLGGIRDYEQKTYECSTNQSLLLAEPRGMQVLWANTCWRNLPAFQLKLNTLQNFDIEIRSFTRTTL